MAIPGKIASLMRKNKLQAASLDGNADEVEAAFYNALQNGDLDKLMACWADEDDIVCVHPGGPRIVGPAAIRATFEAMFVNGTVRAWPEQVRKVEAVGCSVHHLVEHIRVVEAQGDHYGMLVDEILDVIDIPVERIEHPTDAGVAHEAVVGVFAAADRLVHLLDPERMIQSLVRPRTPTPARHGASHGGPR